MTGIKALMVALVLAGLTVAHAAESSGIGEASATTQPSCPTVAVRQQKDVSSQGSDTKGGSAVTTKPAAGNAQ